MLKLGQKLFGYHESYFLRDCICRGHKSFFQDLFTNIPIIPQPSSANQSTRKFNFFFHDIWKIFNQEMLIMPTIGGWIPNLNLIN